MIALSDECNICNGYFFLRVVKNKCPESVAASLGFCFTGLKSQVVHEKKIGNICFVFSFAFIVLSVVLGTEHCNDL